MKTKHGNIAVITLIIVIVAITAGVIGYLFAKKTEAPAQQAVAPQQAPVAETQPIEQCSQSGTQQNTPTESEAPASKSSVQGNGNSIDEQLKIKFSLDILRFWGVRNVFQYSKNPYMFYYIMDSGPDEYVVDKFDASKDKNYLQDENPNMPAYSEPLYREKLSSGNEFRGVDFDGDKFVFTETNKDNSPGPCFSPWMYGNLNYIDINASAIKKQPYVISAQKLEQVKSETADCQKKMFSNQ